MENAAEQLESLVANGVRMADVAERAGVNLATLNRWRSGKTRPHPSTWRLVEAAIVEIQEGEAA